MIKQDWKIMPMMRKSIFDHEKRILIKHSVLPCLLHMLFSMHADLDRFCSKLAQSEPKGLAVMSHRWQLMSFASGVRN